MLPVHCGVLRACGLLPDRVGCVWFKLCGTVTRGMRGGTGGRCGTRNFEFRISDFGLKRRGSSALVTPTSSTEAMRRLAKPRRRFWKDMLIGSSAPDHSHQILDDVHSSGAELPMNRQIGSIAPRLRVTGSPRHRVTASPHLPIPASPHLRISPSPHLPISAFTNHDSRIHTRALPSSPGLTCTPSGRRSPREES